MRVNNYDLPCLQAAIRAIIIPISQFKNYSTIIKLATGVNEAKRERHHTMSSSSNNALRFEYVFLSLSTSAIASGRQPNLIILRMYLHTYW